MIANLHERGLRGSTTCLSGADFFAVVMELFAADGDLDAARDKAVLDTLEQAPHLGVTLLHRQFEVDHRLAAQPFTGPGL